MERPGDTWLAIYPLFSMKLLFFRIEHQVIDLFQVGSVSEDGGLNNLEQQPDSDKAELELEEEEGRDEPIQQ